MKNTSIIKNTRDYFNSLLNQRIGSFLDTISKVWCAINSFSKMFYHDRGRIINNTIQTIIIKVNFKMKY